MPHDLTVLDDQSAEFFAAVPSDLIDNLLAQYRGARTQIAHAAALFAGDMGNVVRYFTYGNCGREATVSHSNIFREEGAVKALNASFWSKALALTDVLDVMPQARRDAWNKQITDMVTPEFSDDTVRPTIESLLASRQQFLAERVDGIFRALSGEHVTNSPMGFGKRMILANMLSYGTVSYDRSGYINDLRGVIAKFMGRDEPKHYASGRALENLRNQWGQWVTFDGGALRIRLYRKGTAHLEVHPDMAWRLNQILAHLHPLAIPSEFRTKPARRAKHVPLILRPLPFAVLDVLAHSLPKPLEKCVQLSWFVKDAGKVVSDEARRVLIGIGGIAYLNDGFLFDYPPLEVLNEILASGCIPDRMSHQYYPTPESLACEAAALAEIGTTHYCLEPSAGTGGLADYMPKERTVCVEASALHCKILEAKGYDVRHADFLTWAAGDRFERIVMNPPFSEGRWQAHVQHAATMLAPGGRLVAIVPASAVGKDVLPGWNVAWSRVYNNEFAGTRMSVVLLVGEKV